MDLQFSGLIPTFQPPGGFGASAIVMSGQRQEQVPLSPPTFPMTPALALRTRLIPTVPTPRTAKPPYSQCQCEPLSSVGKSQ